MRRESLQTLGARVEGRKRIKGSRIRYRLERRSFKRNTNFRDANFVFTVYLSTLCLRGVNVREGIRSVQGIQ